jgi:nucleotide-binding universal stress UspA family protein
MTLVVPFDGSELAEAALVRASEFGYVFDEDVLAVCVIPDGNVEYARGRDWIGPADGFDADAVVSALRRQVADRCPAAEFRHVLVNRYALPVSISRRVREVAKNENASMIFIGSENAGHLVTSVSSVGSNIAKDETYDVVVVRHASPTRISTLREATER